MGRENAHSPEPSEKMSRRKFLRNTLAAVFTGGVATAAAYIEHRTGLPSLILKEKVPVWTESAMDYADDNVELQRTLLLDERTYRVEQIAVTTDNRRPLHVKGAKATFIQYKPDANIQLKQALFGRRNYLLNDSVGVSGPVAPVSGNYTYEESSAVEQRDINMQMPARDQSGTTYGPEDFVDRLPYGVSPETNVSASGGLVFRNGSFAIVDKRGLEEARSQGDSYMQAWYTITDQNESEVMSQDWTHQKIDSEIGNSVYSWSAYVEFTNSSGQKEKGLVVLNGGKDRLALWHVVKMCKKLSSDGSYTLALMDAGNGNPVYFRPESDPDHYYSLGENPSSAHYSPQNGARGRTIKFPFGK